MLFESWHGKVADSPRAISEELHRRGSPLRQLWVTTTGAGAPAWATPVATDSRAHLAALGSAGCIVVNNTLRGYFRKKPATTLLQTWHGTPLKRIGFDVPAGSPAAADDYLWHLAREVRSWDFLISPNRFSTDVLRSAFRFEGEIIETGYPRNDALSSPERNAVRDRVRESLGIPAEARAVLYAPTWRDGATFSLELDLDALGASPDEQVVLLRTHELVGSIAGVGGRRGVIDVSAVPDARELYLAADVLVTDYSSVMFDFAVTGKPILFFTYDLEHYRDEMRGFYFDLEAEAPGPLLRTSAEVTESLANLDQVVADHRSAYARFRERFCHLEDGMASARVVDAVFGP